jgi:hypothetical protein
MARPRIEQDDAPATQAQSERARSLNKQSTVMLDRNVRDYLVHALRRR